MATARYDILIIGSGPAGAAAGITAARAGARVCVVDRAIFPRGKTCGDALSNRGIQLLRELGAHTSFQQAPHTAVEGALVVFPDGSSIRRSYAGSPGCIMRREKLDDLLRLLLEQSGATLIQGMSIRTLLMNDNRYSGAASDSRRIDAKVVIAADGPGSVAWRALGCAAPRKSALALASTAYFSDLEPGPVPGYSEHYFSTELPLGYGWIFPAVDGLHNVGVYQRADAYQRAATPLHALLERFMAQHPDRFAHSRRVGKFRSWSLPLAGITAPPAAPGLLTCGDAARLVDPLSGEGIWQALASGKLAGEAAVEALSRGGLGWSVVRRYQWDCATRVGWPSAARRTLSLASSFIVERGLYQRPVTRALLRWGYERGTLEVSKRVS